MMFLSFVVSCPVLINEHFPCPNRSIGDTCIYSCDAGYELHGPDNATCLTNGSWSEGDPICVPLTCPNIAVMSNTIILPSCNFTYQSQCTVSCDDGFTGDNVTYLCNVTTDPTNATMVDWIPIGGVDVMCQRGLWLLNQLNHLRHMCV